MLCKDNEEIKSRLTLVGVNIKLWTTDIDGLDDLVSYITDKFGNAVWKWM